MKEETENVIRMPNIPPSLVCVRACVRAHVPKPRDEQADAVSGGPIGPVITVRTHSTDFF